MRLYPPVKEEEVREWLRSEAVARWGEPTAELERALESLARSMAAISAVELPEDVEPGLL